MGTNSDIIICDDCWVWCEPKNRCGKTPENTPKPFQGFKKQDLAPVKSLAKPAAAVLPPSPPAQQAAVPEKTYVIKFSSNSCGICGRMAHYDKKVIEELGLTYDYAKRSEPKTWNNFRYLAKQLYPNPESMGFPTYIIAKGSSKDKLTAIGQVRGGSEKGSFRKKIQAVLDSEPLPYGCSHESEGKGTSGSAEYWADVYSNCKLTRSEVTKGSAPRPPKSDERRGKYRQWISNDKPGEDYGNGSHIFHLSDKDTEDGGSSGGGGGNDCDDWKLVVDCPGPGNEGDPLRISAKGEGINDSNLTFKWYIGDDKQGEGSTYNGVYPKCGTSVTFRCVVRKTSCDSSHNKEKTCTVTSNPCGGGGGDPCDGVSCPPGQVCQNGVCVDDGSGSGNPCLPNPCPNGEACMTNGDGTYQCIPTDPCAGVSCPPCHTCVNGICIDLCSNGQICDGGVCKDPTPIDPCDGVVCGDCEVCVNGVCESTCSAGQICEGGVCKDPSPTDPCDGVVCPPDEECVNGICVPVDPCDGVTCPSGEECKDGICVPIDPCDGVVCPDGEECVNGICEPIDLCDGVVCGDCQECQGGVCVDLCSAGQICDGGVCKDPDPCDGVVCGDCQECQGGVCVDLCVAGELCEGGVCVPDPCYNVTCPDCHECVDGNCESICNDGELCENGVCVPDPCYNVDCPECHECVDGNCNPLCVEGELCEGGVCVPDPCYNVDCPECHECVGGNCESICNDGELCENGVCVPDPCYNVDCQDCEECQDGICVDLCPEGEVCDGGVCRDERCLEHECEGGWVIDWECVKNKLNCDGPDCPTPPPPPYHCDYIPELPTLDSDEEISEVSTDIFDTCVDIENLPDLS